ncbi:hypothetical protein Vafri_11383 [Volvox africanus]|nr:hypothetical protein Vafri_11383 [Volvox africanus]
MSFASPGSFTFRRHPPVAEKDLSAALLQRDAVPKLPSTPGPKANLHLVRSDESLCSFTTRSCSTITTTTTTSTSLASDSLSVRLRPVIPSDEAAIREIWIEGWEDTLVQKAPAMWHERVQKARAAVTASATAAALCYTAACSALILLHRPAGSPRWLEWWDLFQRLLSVGRLEGPDLPAVLNALPGIAAVSKWMLAAALVAAVLVITGPLVVPLQLRLAVLRVDFHRMVRDMCPDMWDLYSSWSRPADGREYWVAELLPGGRVVGGAAIKMGTAVRPLAPPAAGAVHFEISRSLKSPGDDTGILKPVDGMNGTHQVRPRKCAGDAATSVTAAQRLPAFPPENEEGFSEFDVNGHGPLEGTDALVYRVVTDRSVRRCGIGRRLMEVLVARAAAVGVRRLVLVTANADAMDFYQRACGFRLRPEARGYCGGKVFWRPVDAISTTAEDGQQSR